MSCSAAVRTAPVPTAFMTAKAVSAGIEIPVPVLVAVMVMAVEIKFVEPIRGVTVIVVVVSVRAQRGLRVVAVHTVPCNGKRGGGKAPRAFQKHF